MPFFLHLSTRASKFKCIEGETWQRNMKGIIQNSEKHKVSLGSRSVAKIEPPPPTLCILAHNRDVCRPPFCTVPIPTTAVQSKITTSSIMTMTPQWFDSSQKDLKKIRDNPMQEVLTFATWCSDNTSPWTRGRPKALESTSHRLCNTSYGASLCRQRTSQQ